LTFKTVAIVRVAPFTRTFSSSNQLVTTPRASACMSRSWSGVITRNRLIVVFRLRMVTSWWSGVETNLAAAGRESRLTSADQGTAPGTGPIRPAQRGVARAAGRLEL
jgi:hypothetical protein